MIYPIMCLNIRLQLRHRLQKGFESYKRDTNYTKRIRIIQKGYELYKKDTNHTKRIRNIIKGYDVFYTSHNTNCECNEG
jgi:hypothetical protein